MTLRQNVRRSVPYIFDRTSRRWEETGTVAGWSTIGEIEKTGIASLIFGPPYRTTWTMRPCTCDGSMGGIKLVFIRAYMPLFLTVAEIYGRKVSKFWKKIEILDFFGPPCRNPLHDFYGSTSKCAEICALHMWLDLTTLRKTETLDGPIVIRKIGKTGIASLTFWLTL